MGDTRGRCLGSPSDCPPGDHLPAPAKAGVGVGGDLGQPGSALALALALEVLLPAPPARTTAPRRTGPRRSRGGPAEAPRPSAARRGGGGKSHPPLLLFFPRGPARPPGSRSGDQSLPPRGPRCGDPTGAPRQRPPTCRERQLCQPVARRARGLAPPTCGSEERATSGRGTFPEDRGQSTPKFSLVQPDHRLPPKGLVGPLIG